jgi:HEAT repeat protein
VLGDLGDGRAAVTLLGSLADPKPEVRAAAATALGKMGGIENAGPLMPLLDDPVEEVQDAAVAALARVVETDPSPVLDALASPAADAGPGMRANLARVLGECRAAAGAGCSS